MNRTHVFERRFTSAVVAMALGAAFPVLAQQDDKPKGVPWGAAVAYPEVDLTFKNNDNIYSQPDSGTRKSANILVIAPKIRVEAKDGPNQYDVGYRVEHGNYSVASANYTDQALFGNAQFVFSGRAGLKLNAEYLLGHDDQGAVPGAATHANPDKYHQGTFGATFGYGAEGAPGRVELELSNINKRYDNFRFDATGAPDNTKRDRDDRKLGATFFWRIAPKTQLLFQAVQTRYDYQQASAPAPAPAGTQLDSTDRKYNFGVTWDAAAKTQGTFKVGNVKKDFKDGALRDFSATGWEGSVRWTPLTYSTITLTTGKTPGESTIGNASLDRRYGINWEHAWSSLTSTTANYNRTDTDYQNNNGVGQTDKIDAWGFKFNYKWTSIVKVGAGYDRTDKRSTNATSQHKKDIWSVFLDAAI